MKNKWLIILAIFAVFAFTGCSDSGGDNLFHGIDVEALIAPMSMKPGIFPSENYSFLVVFNQSGQTIPANSMTLFFSNGGSYSYAHPVNHKSAYEVTAGPSGTIFTAVTVTESGVQAVKYNDYVWVLIPE